MYDDADGKARLDRSGRKRRGRDAGRGVLLAG
jgi:hypothetical protein